MQKRRIFDTHLAPPEEVDAVKAALDGAGIEWYEIPDSSLWGGGALCVRDPVDFDAARSAIETVQSGLRESAGDTPVSPNREKTFYLVGALVILVLMILLSLIGAAN